MLDNAQKEKEKPGTQNNSMQMKSAACWLDLSAQVSSQRQQGGAGDLSSAFKAASFSLWSSCESLRGIMLMPRSLRASWYGAAAFNARDTCPLLPLTSTGRDEPLSVSSVTTLSLPTFTCNISMPLTWQT